MIANKDNIFSLQNLDNYRKNIDNTTYEITEKYYILIREYFKFITENIKVKNTDFSRFIITRGLDTITNVFNNIFYYTKNIDLTYFHCQKSFYFYVEFVGQISEDEKMFLQLSSRDATTYVYKKTIYEINGEIKKNLTATINTNTNANINIINEQLDIINSYINIYKSFLYKIIQSSDLNNNANFYIEIFEKICKKINKTNLNKENVVLLNNIIDKLYFEISNIDYFFNTIQEFLKKMKHTHLKKCEKKIYLTTEEMTEKLNESPEKFITWFLV
jgi:hypothetical protein